MVDTNIRELRQQLIRARRECDPDLLQHVLEGVSHLAGDGYRCCLVDYAACEPAAYVRVVGFENARVKAQLEFPIDPGLNAEQWLPLSHLVDYEEASDAESIRRIYDGVSPYVHHLEAELAEESTLTVMAAPSAPPADGCGNDRGGEEPASPVRPQRRSRRRRAAPPSHRLWWLVAGLLMVLSLSILAGAYRTIT